MDWIDGMNRLLRYIEEHLTDSTLTVETAARHAAYSPFYLQRIFYGLTEVPLSEYFRNRRLSQAGQELQAGAKVIDAALKYGYETPESFQRRSGASTASRRRQPSGPRRSSCSWDRSKSTYR
ncbi:MAG TPA: helix-turn-helix domain-containing protein [Candidatus Limiplasma sp.]|nr:helix-turn-helix domain-containing protein [Candidatus Limiplasma sp.]